MGKKRCLSYGAFLIVSVSLLFPSLVEAKYDGGEAHICCACESHPPPRCPTFEACPTCEGSQSPESGPCGPCPDQRGGSSVSLSEGNLRDTYQVSRIRSSSGPTVDLTLSYDSYNADGSRAAVDTVLGYGWTHSYNIFLFNQRGSMFRMDADGRVTKYQLGAGGTFTPTTGYFETLVKNPDGTFTLTQKDQTSFQFSLVPNTPFLVGGPVYQLLKITDRNGNMTTLSYANGMLSTITDTYGRSLALAYTGQNKLKTVTDPLGRTTTLTYDATGRQLTKITDPDGKSVQYTYNFMYQITRKVDKDGNIFNYVYQSGKPVTIQDGAGNTLFSLSNPLTWATNDTTLALNLMREYKPTTTSKTDGRGNVWKYAYDEHGYIKQVIAPDGATTTYTYDPATLLLASTKDANGHTTSYQYDAEGNRTAVIDHLGHTTRYEYEPVFNNVTRITYPNGSVTEYQYDADGNRIQEIRDVGGLDLLTNWTYDTNGNVLTQEVRNVDPRRVEVQVTSYEYDAFGNQTKMTDPEGNVTRYEYDAVGNRTKMTDGNGHATSYAYDGLDRLKIETDTLGFTTQYTYDARGNRIEVKKQVTMAPDTFQITRYQYDLRNRLVQETRITPAAPLLTKYTYDGNDNRISVTDPRGKVTTFAYDSQNRLTLVKDARGNTTQTLYDGVGNRIRVIDANGHYTYFQYDELNRVVTEIKKIGDTSSTPDANDIVTHSFYDTGASVPAGDCLNAQCAGPIPGSGNVAETIDPEGKVTYLKYDNVNRRVMTIRKVGDTGDDFDRTGNPNDDDWSEVVQYDSVGNVFARTDANGNATTFAYFKNNWKKSEANALSETTTYTYDGAGNVQTVTDPGGNVTTNSYDDRNELIEVNDLVGRVADYTYDGVRNRKTEADGNGNVTSYSYDLVNRLIATTDAMGQITSNSYDPANNLIKTIDREGHATCYRYDDINRRTLAVRKIGDTDCSVIDADDIWTQTDYDGVGNVLALTTAKDGSAPSACNGPSPAADCETTGYVYDEVNRLTQEIYPPRQPGDTAKNTREFTYDPAGNLKTRTDQRSQVTRYAYNDLYYLAQRTYLTSIDSFTYDTGGRMLTASRGGWLVTFDYDAANRVLQTAQNGQTIRYLYDIPNRRRAITYPGGRAIVEQMDLRQRLDKIRDPVSVIPIVDYDYDLGNRVMHRIYRNGVVANYSYNANNWITGLQHTHGATLIAGFGHDYDKEGNKRFEARSPDANRSEAYQYDDIYRLIDYKVGGLVGSTVPMPVTQTQYGLDKLGNWDNTTTDSVTETRTHNAVNEITAIDAVPILSDGNGNLSEDERYLYAYDEENRLISVTRKLDTRVVGQYQYDALSRRILKVADPDPTKPSVETRYFYEDGRIVEEQTPSGATQATYAYGNYVDEVLTMDRGGLTYYYHPNALWSVEAITDSAANVVERYAYDAYGCATITDGTGVHVPLNSWGTAHSANGNPWMFTGRQLDEETGLYFYRARYYDCGKGRFLQRDPLEYSDGYNLYSYVHSNPASHGDPLGLAGYIKCVCKVWRCELATAACIAAAPVAFAGCGSLCEAPPACVACIVVAVEGTIEICNTALECWEEASKMGCVPW